MCLMCLSSPQHTSLMSSPGSARLNCFVPLCSPRIAPSKYPSSVTHAFELRQTSMIPEIYSHPLKQSACVSYFPHTHTNSWLCAGQGQHQCSDHPHGKGLWVVPHSGRPGAKLLLLGLYAESDPRRVRELTLWWPLHPAAGRGALVWGYCDCPRSRRHHSRYTTNVATSTHDAEEIKMPQCA